LLDGPHIGDIPLKEQPIVATVYRFQVWDIRTDQFQASTRWATREAIDRVGGEITSEGVQIEERLLGGDIRGMTTRNFDARRPSWADFQISVR
jgi:hypothetical protein